MDYSIVSIFNKQKVVKNGSVFRIKLDGKVEIAPQTILDAKIIDLSQPNLTDADGKVQVLHARKEKGIFVKKKRRKRYQRKMGFSKCVLTLKHIK